MITRAESAFTVSDAAAASIQVDRKLDSANDVRFSTSTVTSPTADAIRMRFDKMMSNIITDVQAAPVNGDDLRNPLKMSDITREELDTKLELLLARSDARARETELQAEARLSRFEERIDQAISEMRRDRSEVKAAIGSLKTTTVVTAITAVLAIVFGVAAFNATVLSNMVASFESGKNTATSISEATSRLERLQDRIEASQPNLARPAAPAKR